MRPARLGYQSPRCLRSCYAGCSRPKFSTRAPGSRGVMITTPIFYVNGPPHIGHIYSAVLADALARWHRVLGNDTFLLTGTDEHGSKVSEAARKAGQSEEVFCASISGQFRQLFSDSQISFDRFIRTTDDDHIKAVQHLWKVLQDAGHIYLGKYEGWYSVSDEAMLTRLQVTEVKVEKTGGTKKVSIESGHKVEWVTEENYLFRLSSFQEPLLRWLRDCPDALQPPTRTKEVVSFISAGLEDLSVSRRADKVKWGIPVPGDDKHTIYVWLDALTNYLTGYPDQTSSAFQRRWPPAVQLIGKDITRFHAIYWPAFLLGAGLPLPRSIVSHAHWTSSGTKMSKSLGNVVRPQAEIAKYALKSKGGRLLSCFLLIYGLDAFRFFLLNEGGLEDDADYSPLLVEMNLNHILADLLGNLAGRALARSLNPDGKYPRCGPLQEIDKPVVELLKTTPARVDDHYRRVEFKRGLALVREVLEEVNKYVAKAEPWKEKNAPDRERLDTVLYIMLEAVRISALLLQPIIPDSANRILSRMGVPPDRRGAADLQFGLLPSNGSYSTEPLILFPKIKPAAAPAKAPAKAKSRDGKAAPK